MGFFPSVPPIVSLADSIARLVKSPRVQFLGNQLKGTFPQAAGPLRLPQKTTGAHSQSSGISNTVHNQVTNILGALANQSGQQTQAIDPLQALYQQLVSQLQSPVQQPQAINTQDLMDQVKKAINPIYDARAQTATNRTTRARQDVSGMYDALSQDYQKLAPQQVEQAKAAQADIEKMYGQLRSNIEGSYSRVSKEQGDLFKSLGIESALPDVLNKQAPAVQEASMAASENQAQQEQRYMDMGNIDSTFYREGAPLAKMTGNEISTNMLSQLGDYLNQVDADRASGIQTGYLDQLGQAQTRLGQQQQAAQTESARRQEMLWQMLQGQLQGKQQAALNPDTYMGQLPSGLQQSVAGAFTRLERSPEAVYGKVEDPRNPVPGTYVQTTPEWYMAQADQMLANGEIDPATHQALLMYLQLNFKQ